MVNDVVDGSTSVRVAVRIRPLGGSERVQECAECIRQESATQVILGDNRLFTYDYTYGQRTQQATMFDQCVRPLLESFINGYNSTIIAYGQTGSGKSHTMGTESTGLSTPELEKGIVPRVINTLFERIKAESASGVEYSVRCSFLENYNDELKDLLDPSTSKTISIRETPNGDVVPFGIEEREVHTARELLLCLEEGSVHRSTGSTLMNAHSSRSHAIFTVSLSQRRSIEPVAVDEGTDDLGERPLEEAEFIASKFSFVDLAGSERLKKTGAVGDRRREGININSGLLALGNVISALGDPTRKGSHVPFRDSKITRLLQDSLGGNSRTLMVACVSPADVHFDETLNTLRYAARARNIVNKPIIGRDPNSQKLELYRQRIQRLEAALSQLGVDASRIWEASGATDLNIDRAAVPVEGAEDVRSQMTELRQENTFLDSEVLRLMEIVKIDRQALSDAGEQKRDALCQRDAAQAALRNLLEKAQVNGSVDADLIYAETQVARDAIPLSTYEADLEEQRRVGLVVPDECVDQSDNESDEDTDVDDEVDQLQVTKKKKDREFRRINEYNARALRRFDADIDHKNALIEQLIKSKKNSEALRERYEQKIHEMETCVRMTKNERDTVIQSLEASRDSTQSHVETVKTEFQTKLAQLTEQLEDVRRKYKENERILRSRPKNDLHINGLRDDIERIKKQRVALQRQMKEEAEKHRLWVQENNRQVAVLQKQVRKDNVEMGRMHAKLYQQDQVLKIKTEKATVLQRELTEVKRRMTGTNKRARSTTPAPLSINVKSAVRRVINASVLAREVVVQRQRLEEQRRDLETKLSQATVALVENDPNEANYAAGHDNAELQETVDDIGAQLDFVKSKIDEIVPSNKKGGAGRRLADRKDGAVSEDILNRIGIDCDNAASLRSLVVDLLNQAVSQRLNRSLHRKRIVELENEIMQLQTENDSSAARLEVIQRESNRRVISAEKDHDRELQAILDVECSNDGRTSIRELELQLSTAKLQQSKLLSPIAEHPPRKSRRIARLAAISETKNDPSSAPRRLRPRSLTKVSGIPTCRTPSPVIAEPAEFALAPFVPSQLAFSSGIPKRLPSRAVLGIEGATVPPVVTISSALAKPSDERHADRRDILSRLTDKAMFTGTSRYVGRRGKRPPASAEGSDAECDHPAPSALPPPAEFRPSQQLMRSPRSATLNASASTPPDPKQVLDAFKQALEKTKGEPTKPDGRI